MKFHEAEAYTAQEVAALLEGLRARCAASAYIDAKNMMRSGMVRDRILALPLISDGAGMPQTKAEELVRIKARRLEEARTAVAKMTSSDELSGPHWVSWFDKAPSDVSLDGRFTHSDLEAIMICMQAGDPSPC